MIREQIPTLGRTCRVASLALLFLMLALVAGCAGPGALSEAGQVYGPQLPPGSAGQPRPPEQPAPRPPSGQTTQGDRLIILHTNDVAGFVDPCG